MVETPDGHGRLELTKFHAPSGRAATGTRRRTPRASANLVGMRQRILLLLGTLYVGAALIGHAKERRGAMTCECQDACWCKRPGIRLFRWVLPLGHKLR